MATIQINDASHHVSDEVAKHIADLSRRTDSSDPAKVAERAELLLVASRVVGSTAALSSLSNRALRERLIATLSPERRADSSMSDEYVHGMLDALIARRRMDGPTGVPRNEGLLIVQSLIDGTSPRRNDASPDPIQARLDAVERKLNAAHLPPAQGPATPTEQSGEVASQDPVQARLDAAQRKLDARKPSDH